tara:strand:- start:64 stop:231 length:168 start_codon:yes stop_codon:yes gene_type:complete
LTLYLAVFAFRLGATDRPGVKFEELVKTWAERACLDERVAMVNCVPVFIASDAAW